jgi:hypothetical protein
MALMNAWTEGSATDMLLLGAQSGKRTVILRMACHTPVAGTVTLKTRAGAAPATPLTGPLTIGPNQLNDVQFGRAYALTTNVGESLVADVAIGQSGESVYLTIWYEIVP